MQQKQTVRIFYTLQMHWAHAMLQLVSRASTRGFVPAPLTDRPTLPTWKPNTHKTSPGATHRGHETERKHGVSVATCEQQDVDVRMTQVQESDRAKRADWPIHRCSIPIPRVENPIPKAFCDVAAAKRQKRRANSNTGIIAERARGKDYQRLSE